MKTHGALFPEIVTFANLMAAARLAAKGRRMLPAPGKFLTKIETGVLRLQEELLAGTWRPGPYKAWFIHEPKKRMISAAPFRDRVVHHAVCRVVMPLFDRRMIHDLWSNRPGKGTHGAVDRAQYFCRRFQHVLKCDVRKFFPSIDHEVMKEKLRRTVRCRRTLEVLDWIIAGSNPQETVCAVFPGDDLAEAASRRVGLPIGNLTSQWFGGIMLSAFDHWVKDTLHCEGYLRYVDDFLLFSDSREQLRDWRAAIIERLAADRLHLAEEKSRSFPTAQGVTFLGVHIWPDHRRMDSEKLRKARRRMGWFAEEVAAGRTPKETLTKRWAAWRGHALHAGGRGLLMAVAAGLRAKLGTAGNQTAACCGAARGTTPRPTCAAPTATTTHHRTPTTTMGSGVSGGREAARLPAEPGGEGTVRESASHARPRSPVSGPPPGTNTPEPAGLVATAKAPPVHLMNGPAGAGHQAVLPQSSPP